jgi:hypothetical protein
MVTVRGPAGGGAAAVVALGLAVAAADVAVPDVAVRVEDDAAAPVVDCPRAASYSLLLGPVLAGVTEREAGLVDVTEAVVGEGAPWAVQDAAAQTTANTAAARRHLTAQMLRAAASIGVGPTTTGYSDGPFQRRERRPTCTPPPHHRTEPETSGDGSGAAQQSSPPRFSWRCLCSRSRPPPPTRRPRLRHRRRLIHRHRLSPRIRRLPSTPAR